MKNQRASKQTPESLNTQGFGKKLANGVGMLMLASTAMLSAADFLPLAPGNNWTYRDAKTGSSFKIEIGRTQIQLRDHTYHVLKGYTPKQVFVRANEIGNIYYWNEDLDREEILISFEIVPGAWFEANARQCPEQGQVQDKPGLHDGPAGNWGVLDITYRSFACADAGDLSEQFADNIGMVRRVVNTFAGPRTYDLVQARIGKQSIQADREGSFRISAELNPQQDAWNATLRVDQSSSSGIKARFPSSQEYDLRLRGEDGQILWTWSADKLFAQAEHERTFSVTWSATVAVPIPPGIPESRRTIVLEAWLTTGAGEPQFASATIIEVPGIAPAPPVVEARRARR